MSVWWWLLADNIWLDSLQPSLTYLPPSCHTFIPYLFLFSFQSHLGLGTPRPGFILGSLYSLLQLQIRAQLHRLSASHAQPSPDLALPPGGLSSAREAIKPSAGEKNWETASQSHTETGSYAGRDSEDVEKLDPCALVGCSPWGH